MIDLEKIIEKHESTMDSILDIISNPKIFSDERLKFADVLEKLSNSLVNIKRFESYDKQFRR